ncbi:TPA: VCBS domain-containing protein [Vibrio parahaemolyticus]|nr:VCBS domain-containing protein [Vibrio parahaemolyticus]HBC3519710.1 VCBS domain-containing protein [Vibrio parahaemolyticus]
MSVLLDVSSRTFQSVHLVAAARGRRDVMFEGAVLASVKHQQHHYQLYQTRSDNSEEQLVVCDADLSQGDITAEIIGVNDTDVLSDVLGLDVMYEVCRQCQYPGYQTLGTPLGEWA